MNTRLHIIALVSLLGAVTAWGIFGGGAYYIIDLAQTRAKEAKIAVSKSNQKLLDQQQHALAESTKEKRAGLTSLMETDVVSAINLIDSIGKGLGLDVRVKDAAPDGILPLAGGEPIHKVSFVVQGEGSYDDLLHLAELYEKIPLITTLQNIEIDRIESSEKKAAVWHMTAHIRLFTTAPVSI